MKQEEKKAALDKGMKDKAGSQCKEENFCLYEKHGTEARNHTKKIRTIYAGKGKIKPRKDFMK